MKNGATFTKQTVSDMRSIVRRMDSLLSESCDGDLMLSQKMFLGELIKDFAETPIVKNSGLIISK